MDPQHSQNHCIYSHLHTAKKEKRKKKKEKEKKTGLFITRRANAKMTDSQSSFLCKTWEKKERSVTSHKAL